MRPILFVPLKFGIIGAGMVIAMFLVFYLSGENPLIESGTFDLFILPIFIFFGIKEFRDTYNDKWMEFGQGMTVGFLVYFSIALVSSLFVYVFVQFLDHTLLTGFIRESLASLDENKLKIIEEMGVTSFEESRDKVSQTTSFDMALDGFLKKLIVGLMLTSFTAVILKRSPQTT